MSKNPQIKGARHFANMFDVFIKEAEPKMQEIGTYVLRLLNMTS